VTLSNPTTQVVTVQYATQNQTALAGSDYVAVAPTTITFQPGETTKTVTINVIGDTVRESNELFAVNLLNPVNATLGTSRGFGNIVNDD
jgi:fibronectin-binding autotransporter adhesin